MSTEIAVAEYRAITRFPYFGYPQYPMNSLRVAYRDLLLRFRRITADTPTHRMHLESLRERAATIPDYWHHL